MEKSVTLSYKEQSLPFCYSNQKMSVCMCVRETDRNTQGETAFSECSISEADEGALAREIPREDFYFPTHVSHHQQNNHTEGSSSNDNYDNIQFYFQFCSSAQNSLCNLMQVTSPLWASVSSLVKCNIEIPALRLRDTFIYMISFALTPSLRTWAG